MIKPRAVIYVRVSDKTQIDNNSLETQEKACLDLIKTRDYELAREPFREEGFTAKNLSGRPSLQELLLYCTNKKNKISFVIVYKLDRWARNTQDGLAAEALLSKYGVELISVLENISKDPTGTFLKTIFLGAAQWDNEMKGLRVSDNQKTMFNNGRWCWKPPVGYKRPTGSKEERKGKVSVIDKNLGPMIKTIFQEAGNGIKNKTSLANIVNSLGFGNYYNKKADCNLISKIVKNTFYYGLMYAPKWKLYQMGLHEPLIDENLWHRANSNLFGKRKYQSQDLDLFPLKGFIKCGICGHFMTTSNPRGKFRYYECKQKKCSKQQRILIDRAEKQFISILKTIKPSKQVLKLFNSMIFNEWDKTIQIQKQKTEEYEKRILELKDLISGFSISANKGLLTEDEAIERIRKTRIDITTLEMERGDISIEKYNLEITRNFTELFLSNIDNFWIRLNLIKKQLLQNKIFPDGILCQNKEIRTNTLSPSFKLIHILDSENYSLVTLRRIGLRLPG